MFNILFIKKQKLMFNILIFLFKNLLFLFFYMINSLNVIGLEFY